MCQHTNTRTFDKTKPELHPIKVQSPWHHIGIDLVGPLPITARNNRYILTLSDYCTKWVDAVPLESKCATGIALALFKVFYSNALHVQHACSNTYHPVTSMLCYSMEVTGDGQHFQTLHLLSFSCNKKQ